LLHPNAICSYIDRHGNQCSSRRFLQIDHIHSWSLGGTHDPQNLQVMCGIHNRIKYEQG
jgi:5-methylcytosine-specific restriction endonuclease McrA